jgi:DNA-binding beta-propeller fold protein YncE
MTEPMTPPEPTPSAAPAAAPAGATLAMAGAAAGAAGAVVGPEVATAPTPPRRRRRRMAVLIILLIILGLVALFAGWYLVTRKPISELPVIPPVPTNPAPAYSTSLYGGAEGGLDSPTGVAVTADGSRVYVAQSGGSKTVVILDAKGERIGELKPPVAEATDHVPVYVAVNPTNGDVYVSDRLTAKVYVYSPEGVYRRTFDPGKDITNAGWLPLGMGFAKDGSLYVTNLSAPAKVHQFAPDGSFVQTILPTKEELDFPNGVWPDGNGNIYVSDSNNGRLRVFASDGREIGSVARGAREGDLGLPRGVVIDDQNRVFVVDTSAHAVNLYKTLGPDERRPAYLARFGTQGTTDGAFEFPNGIAADARGRIYVTDTANNRVQVWSY